MEKFIVNYKVRQAGAAGVFWVIELTVEAENESDAMDVAFDELHDLHGYETFHCVSVVPYVGSEPDDGSD